MKKLLLSALAISSIAAMNTSTAQLAAGSIAPDYTVTAYQTALASQGLNNNGTYRLYDYLDAGYTVFMDVSATWCGPCWNYHNGGALDALYTAHGPAGFPGVSASTTDNVMVIWVEGDGTTADATMLTGSGSLAGTVNWINPGGAGEIPFPMANPASASATQINNDYNIGYFPTIYKICPNRTVTEVGQLAAAALYSTVGSCPPAASQTNDPAMLSYQGKEKSCSAIDLIVRLQNNGTSPMTACTITATEGATQIVQYNWSGNLATYGYQDVTIGQFTPTSSHNITISITSADQNTANNTITKTLSRANTGANNSVTVKVSTDQYKSETSWKIFRSNGQVAYTSPSYGADAAAAGTIVQTDVVTNLVNDCYRLEVYDAYGDGFDSGYGDGSVEIFVNGTAIAGVTSFPAGTLMMDAFEINAVAGLNEELASTLSVYPNPASDELNVSFEATNADYKVSILDLQGRVITTKTLQSLNGTSTVTFPVADMAKGSYIVTVVSNGITTTKNVVIK